MGGRWGRSSWDDAQRHHDLETPAEPLQKSRGFERCSFLCRGPKQTHTEGTGAAEAEAGGTDGMVMG